MAYLGGSVRVGARIAEGVGHFSSSRGGRSLQPPLGGGYNPTDAPGVRPTGGCPCLTREHCWIFFPFVRGLFPPIILVPPHTGSIIQYSLSPDFTPTWTFLSIGPSWFAFTGSVPFPVYTQPASAHGALARVPCLFVCSHHCSLFVLCGLEG